MNDSSGETVEIFEGKFLFRRKILVVESCQNSNYKIVYGSPYHA